jgi:diguanylate cyclase (GGDEF)-like protein
MIRIIYKTPTSAMVKINRLFVGIIVASAVFFQNIHLIHLYFLLNLITAFTTIYYSISSAIYMLIVKSGLKICMVPSDYERSYFMNKESERFELLSRISVSFIAIMIYPYSHLTTWIIASVMSIFMMISTFYGFCLSSLIYIGYLKFFKQHDHKNTATTNINCAFARNGFKPYSRCDSCSLNTVECTGLQSNAFIFAIGFLASMYMFFHFPIFERFNLILILALLFWLGHKITITIDQITNANSDNKKLNLQLKNQTESLEMEVRRRTDELEKLVCIDAITGLNNRYEFELKLKSAIEEAQTYKVSHVLAYIDLDQFKIVNDKCGHIAGDELLRQIALILKLSIRESDLVARLGGDEFAIIYYNSTIDAAKVQSQRLLNAIGEYRFSWQGSTFGIGASIGMVGITQEACSLTNILSQADAACYAAKDGGRNRIHLGLLDDATVQDRRNEMQWIGRLEEALIENSFVLYAQPIVPVINLLEQEHYEVLIRLRGKNGEIIPPMAFIPAAERYGFMPKLDKWVIENTFKTFVQMRAEDKNIHFSVNISGASMGDAKTKQFVNEQFKIHNIPYDSITFEITESEAISNMVNALSFINEFRALGCKFALDDFGCGLSSFSYLQNMPIDFLKIDGSFVKDIDVNSVNRAMVAAINDIGHVMGLKTICEFVENQDIVDVLINLNVDYAQGYHISKPIPIEQLFNNPEVSSKKV